MATDTIKIEIKSESIDTDIKPDEEVLSSVKSFPEENAMFPPLEINVSDIKLEARGTPILGPGDVLIKSTDKEDTDKLSGEICVDRSAEKCDQSSPVEAEMCDKSTVVKHIKSESRNLEKKSDTNEDLFFPTDLLCVEIDSNDGRFKSNEVESENYFVLNEDMETRRVSKRKMYSNTVAEKYSKKLKKFKQNEPKVESNKSNSNDEDADDSKMFACKLCDYVGSKKYFLQTHVTAMHEKKKPYSCPYCDHTSSYNSNLRRHILSKHESTKPYLCSVCNYRGKRKSDLIAHVQSRHINSKPYGCPLCSFRANLKSGLDKHYRVVHPKVKLYKCSHCTYTSVKEAEFSEHNRQFHPNGKNGSAVENPNPNGNPENIPRENKPVCKTASDAKGKEESSSNPGIKIDLLNNKFLLHMKSRKRHTMIECVCHHCGFSSLEKSRVRKHIVLVHLKLVFPCKFCDRKLTSKVSLKNHVLFKHSNYKAFTCSYCGLKTGSNSHLKRHVTRMHETDRSFACNECLSVFEKKSERTKHMKTVHREKRYACERCEFRACLKKDLIRHRKSDHVTIPICHQCELCSYSTPRRNRLRQHVERVHESKKS